MMGGPKKNCILNAMAKRKRSSASIKSARKATLRMAKAKRPRLAASTLGRSVARLNRMIETKESTGSWGTNIGLPHNNTVMIGANPFTLVNGNGDPMTGTGNRIGDRITVNGLLLKGFFENALQRSKVHYKVMLVRGAKGETFTRSTLYKNNSNNKMIDLFDTERFTIVASKKFTISCSSAAASSVQLVTGAPVELLPSGTTFGGQGSHAFSMWIPGRKFGRSGNVQYENGSTTQLKFYDYRIVVLAYDWYGTPQDANNVGIINEAYLKLYYKDA